MHPDYFITALRQEIERITGMAWYALPQYTWLGIDRTLPWRTVWRGGGCE